MLWSTILSLFFWKFMAILPHQSTNNSFASVTFEHIIVVIIIIIFFFGVGGEKSGLTPPGANNYKALARKLQNYDKIFKLIIKKNNIHDQDVDGPNVCSMEIS